MNTFIRSTDYEADTQQILVTISAYDETSIDGHKDAETGESMTMLGKPFGKLGHIDIMTLLRVLELYEKAKIYCNMLMNCCCETMLQC